MTPKEAFTFAATLRLNLSKEEIENKVKIFILFHILLFF